MDKRKYYLKAALIGALGTTIGTYSYANLGNVSFNVPIWITSLVFMEHFQFILLFWLAFENTIGVKNWVLFGFWGSALCAISFWVSRGFLSLEPSSVYYYDKLFMGTLGSIPIWFVLQRHYSRAYLWVFANAIGYAFIGVFPVIWSFLLNIRLLKHISGTSFLTGQLLPNGLWVIAYSLFGLLLGVCLDRIIGNNGENVVGFREVATDKVA